MPATLLRGRLLAPDLLARALGHVLPLVGSVVLLRLAGAGVPGGAAVVLAGLGDAVALLLVLGLRHGVVAVGGAHRDEAREGALEELAAGGGVHGRVSGVGVFEGNLTIRPPPSSPLK